MTDRVRVASGAPWEGRVGYSRAVRAGAFVYVSGTAPVDAEGRALHPGDGYRQTVAALEKVRDALLEAGGRLEEVVRTRMYVTDIDRWEEFGRAHGEFFGEVRPATTMVEVRRLIAPDLLIEVEAEAVLERDAPGS